MKHFAIFLFLISGVAAHADVAPTIVALSLHPTKPGDQGLEIYQGLFSQAVLQPVVKVRMAAEVVKLDVYPTMMHVHAEFWMEPVGDFEDTLSVGFPEATADFHGVHLDELQIRVDGKNVPANLVQQSVRIDGSTRTESWWLFDVVFRRAQKVMINVDYYQVFYLPSQPRLLDRRQSDERYDHEHFIIQTGYVFRTGRLWWGTIGQADVGISLHGIEREQIAVRFDGEQGSDTTLHWLKKDWEPESNLIMEVRIPITQIDAMRSGQAPYGLSEVSKAMSWTDAIVRFGRSPVDTTGRPRIDENEWQFVIDGMIAAARQETDKQLQSDARETLRFWRIRLMQSDWFNPAELAFALDWLNPDEKLSDDEMSMFRTRSPESSEKMVPKVTPKWSWNNPLAQLEYNGNRETVFSDPEVFMEMVSVRMQRQRLIFWGVLAAVSLALAGVLIYKKRQRRLAEKIHG